MSPVGIHQGAEVNILETNGYPFREWVSEERLFDLSLLEFQAGFWQSDGDIQEIEEVLALADDDSEKETAAAIDALFDLLLKYGEECSLC